MTYGHERERAILSAPKWWHDICLTVIFQHNPSMLVSECLHSGFITGKDNWGGGDNWRRKNCKAPVKLAPPINQHRFVHRPDVLPAAQPTASEHWREKSSHSTDLPAPAHPTLSLTTKGSWLAEGCQASHQTADASTPHTRAKTALFGTIYPQTFVLNQPLRASRTFLRRTYLDLHLAY